jgi:hypothetical protein
MNYHLRLLPGRFAVCSVPLDTPVSDLVPGGKFWSVTRARDQLTVLVPEEQARGGWRTEPGWRCLEVAGPLEFSQIGVLSALTTALAEAEISVYAVSTYSTDLILLKEAAVERARDVLSRNGHNVEEERS